LPIAISGHNPFWESHSIVFLPIGCFLLDAEP
jgi:hypothetical protein